MLLNRSLIHIWRCVALLAALFVATSCNSGSSRDSSARSFDSQSIQQWQTLTLTLIEQTPGFSPPVVSRALGYTSLAVYESIVAGMPAHQSLVGQLNGLNYVPAPTAGAPHHWGAVANATFAEMLRLMFPVASDTLMDQIDATETQIADGFAANTASDVMARSRTHGRAVATAVFEWSVTDGGLFGYLTNASPGFTPPVGAGLWVPTAPGFAPALQATWGENRTFVIDSGESCQPGPHPDYSTDPSSAFYAEAQEVYDVTQSLTADQAAIAEFWADGGGTVTPPGHWVSILRQLAARDGWSLDVAAEAFCKVGLCVADAFISCWYAKFDQNLLRPITFIQTNIDGAWTPLIATPPFPEYTSGHSTQSGAVAVVLTSMFGEDFAFTDDTHAARSLPARTFTSFQHAADEAAISRLYGGIHFRAAIDNGVAQGLAIGREVDALRFRRDAPAAPIAASTASHDSADARAWFDLALTLIQNTAGYSPPVASRALGYAGVTLYETVRPGMDGYRSLVGQLNDFTATPRPLAGVAYHWPSAANAAMARILRHLFPTTSSTNLDAITALETQQAASYAAIAAATRTRSIAYGRAVADAVFFWARSDRGHEGYTRNFPTSYTAPVGAGLWEPTLPGLSIALQPFWGANRTMALDTGDAVDPGAPPPYSTSTTSRFYQEADEVYQTTTSLTQEQLDIATWWADNAGTTPTPPGHSVAMLTTILEMRNAKLDVAAEAYAKVGIAVSDAFVCCWASKYRYNLLRPITYIQAQIDAGWTPAVSTPPFPEYTSGHSVQSGAWAEVMTDLFGNAVAFTDDTNVSLNLPARTFASFYAAAYEAAISRLYGGIHFRSAIDVGVQQGRQVGQVVNSLTFREP